MATDRTNNERQQRWRERRKNELEAAHKRIAQLEAALRKAVPAASATAAMPPEAKPTASQSEFRDKDTLLQDKLAKAMQELAEKNKEIARLKDAAKLGQVVAEPEIKREDLSQTAQARLAAAERQMRRRLDAEHAVRMAAIAEEVRQKVVAQNTEYLAKLNAMEREARETKHTYRDFMGRQTKIFSNDEFRLVMLCVHADASISVEKRDEATRLLLSRRFALTGEK